MFRANGFLNTETCGLIRRAMDEGEVEPAEVLAEGALEQPDVRSAASIEVEESVLALVEVTLEESREPLGAFFGVELGSREGPGFLRYSEGGFYKPHRDRAETTAWPDAARRLLTIVLFLNDQFTGGELRLLPDGVEPILIRPRTGTLVAFDAGVVHEVVPVVDGRRYAVVDWWLG